MMITTKDKKIIQSLSKKYNAKRVLLFGSSLTSNGNDIDLAVEGVVPKHFFDFYSDLMFALSKPVDLIDLIGSSKFVELIRKEGVLLYG